MVDDIVFRRLLAILRLGSSDMPEEADTAFRKGIAMMDAQGMTIDRFLERVDPKAFPQELCAELARRYCRSREDRTSSDRDIYYRRIFAAIARKYAPEEFREEPSRARNREPAGRKPDQPLRPEPGTTSGSEPDWVRKMEEQCQRAKEEQRRKETRANDDARRTEEQSHRQRQSRHTSEAWTRPDYRPRKQRSSSASQPASPVWRMPRIRNEFLLTALRHPGKTVHLFAVCALASIIPGLITAVVVAGAFRYAGIHALDWIEWDVMLATTMFPFMCIYGRRWYRRGWFHM